MREEIAAAGGLPLQRLAEVIGLDLQHHQVRLARKVPPRGFLRLGGGREVDEAVGEVQGRALEQPGLVWRRPGRARQDLIDSQSPRSGKNRPSNDGRPSSSKRNTAAAAVGN